MSQWFSKIKDSASTFKDLAKNIMVYDKEKD